MPVPPWLEELLRVTFFTLCRNHAAACRNECNLFCLDCPVDGAFCPGCRSSHHKDHRVIQIRRSSYHDVVRVSEIEKVLDIGGVQTYVINSARVLFLNERPQPRFGKTVSHVCEICGRSLLDTFRFCSLGCKLEGIKRNGNARFSLDEKAVEESGEEESRDGSSQDMYPPTPPPSSSTCSYRSFARRRKGIPQRATFKP